MKGTIDQSGSMDPIGDLIADIDNIEFPEVDDMYTLGEYGALSPLNVFRPVRFDFYARYRPFKTDLLVIKPNIGFTLSNNSLDPMDMDVYFNGAAEVQLHLGKFIPGYLFTLYFSTGIDEGFWQNRLGFQLNLRALELDFEFALRSQSYAGSFDARGLAAKLGLKFGW
jgi:hypothetical protein